MAESSEQEQQDVGKVTDKARRSPNGLWFGIIVLLIIAGVASAGFYLFMQLRDRQEGLGGEVKGQMSKQLADYQSQLSAIQNQLAALEVNIGNKDGHFTQTLADFSRLHTEKLDSTRKELTESIQQLQRQLGKTRGDWLIADAEYLLSVANERLQLVGDVNTTRLALEAADQRLRESGDVGVINVREQIAQEIAQIRNVSAPDIIGIYATLQSLENSVDKLALLLPYAGKALTPSTELHDHTDEQPIDDHGLLQSAINSLEGVVTIRHTDQPVQAILTPEQAQFIREQLRVKLAMAKIAVVERNDNIYHASLKDTQDWLEQQFSKNNDSRTLSDELSRLNTLSIHGQFPDISLSFKMLKDIAKLRLEAEKGMKTEDAPKVTPMALPPIIPAPAPAPTAPEPEKSPEAE